VLVRLPIPPVASRDIVKKGFGVSGGENSVGFASSWAIGGEIGVSGRGFSRLRSLVLRSWYFGREVSGVSAKAVRSGVPGLDRSPVKMFAGLLEETVESLRMRFRTPVKKSPRSA